MHRVLIADDNIDLAIGLQALLEGEGHKVAVAHNGYTALELARHMRPDVVFLDIVMPGLDGYELAGLLRRELETELKIFAMSGFSEQRDQERARNAGIDQYLVKPVDPAFIASLLGRGKRPEAPATQPPYQAGESLDLPADSPPTAP